MYWDKRLPQGYEDLLVEYGQAPHCDAAVLHAPGDCWACDQFPRLHGYRITAGINFTGSSDPSKRRCWAEECRDTRIIYKWAGNRPQANQPAPEPRVGNG